jgi:hypothetical protein
MITEEKSIPEYLKNWVPYRLIAADDETLCRWLYLGNEPIEEPFFDDTISKCVQLRENSSAYRIVSNIDLLPEWASMADTAKPAAIIFHISRCGSTLFSQLLGQQPSNIILSEVPFFDEILRDAFKKNNLNNCLPLLKAAVQLYSVKRTAEQQRLFIKADSWHVHFYSELRELYPGIPFILLYRKPAEVITSHQKKRGMQAVPGLLEPELFGFNKNEILQCGLDEYMAKVLETYLSAFIKIVQTDSLAVAVNYHEGPLAVLQKIADVTNLSFTNAEQEAIKKRADFHGKYPGQVFFEPAPAAISPPFLNKADNLYKELESIRKSKYND